MRYSKSFVSQEITDQERRGRFFHGTKIIVVSHKNYWMPDDKIYLPVFAGPVPDMPEGFVRDNTGDNISGKNPNFCELTGLYWAWKNLDADYLGLAHYRRHFSIKKNNNDKKGCVLTGEQLEAILADTDVVLPKPRNYFIETNYSQYVHAHHAEDLDTTREIISEMYPEYLKAYDASMKRTTGHRFNMFIMRRDLADAWCTWLFDILFELEKRLDISQYSKNDARVFGFVGERLLDVWIETNDIKYKELSCVFMEDQNRLKKGSAFVLRKLRAGRNGR